MREYWKNGVVGKWEEGAPWQNARRRYIPQQSETATPQTAGVKMVKDSPLGDQLMAILSNDDLVEASGHRVHTIFGEKAIVENERKLVMVVAGEIYLEFTGDNDTNSADLVKFARKLDLRLLKKMK